MKILDFAKIMLLCVITMGMASCGDDIYYTTIQNSDEKFCGMNWVDESGEDGEAYTYLLKFGANNKGQEVTITYEAGGKVTVDREFSWRWLDESKEAIRLTFADNTAKIFENVWVREHYLSGKLNGEVMMLVDANYK